LADGGGDVPNSAADAEADNAINRETTSQRL
jgi:hypothetical protein